MRGFGSGVDRFEFINIAKKKKKKRKKKRKEERKEKGAKHYLQTLNTVWPIRVGYGVWLFHARKNTVTSPSSDAFNNPQIA